MLTPFPTPNTTALTDRVSPCWMSLNQHPCRVSSQRENTPSWVTFRVHKWLRQSPTPSITAAGRDICRGSEWHRTAMNFLHPASPAYQAPLFPGVHLSGEGNRRWSQWSCVEYSRGQAQEGTQSAHTHIHKRHTERASMLSISCLL